MRKSLTALSVATTIAVAAAVTPTTADARPRSWSAYPYHGYGYGYGPYYAYSEYYYGRYGAPPDGYLYVYVPRPYYRVRR